MIWDERIEETLRNHDAYINGKDEGFYDGKSIGEKIGKSIGEAKTRREMVINMYKKNYAVDIIADATNLSILEIEKIIKSNKDDK